MGTYLGLGAYLGYYGIKFACTHVGAYLLLVATTIAVHVLIYSKLTHIAILPYLFE